MADHPAYGARPPYYDPRGPARAHSSMRASDADRERLVEVLKTAFAEGRLTQDEYTARMERAYLARTYGELGALVADLPAPLPYKPYQPMRPNSLAVASLVFGIAEFFTAGLTAIPAVVLGYKARRQIRETGEPGSGMARAGLALGWTAIGLYAFLLLLAVLGTVVATAHSGHAYPGPGTGFVPHGGVHVVMPFVRGPAGGGPVG